MKGPFPIFCNCRQDVHFTSAAKTAWNNVLKPSRNFRGSTKIIMSLATSTEIKTRTLDRARTRDRFQLRKIDH